MTAYVTETGHWRSPRLRPADDAVAAWAAKTLAGIGSRAQALCVATLDSGARESVHFWRASRASGLAFANPRPFPWTLANSPTGRIAQHLGLRGATFTMVGRADALGAALEHALEELASGRAERALVAALDGTTEEETRLAALLLATTRGAGMLATVAPCARPDGASVLARGTASETLAAVIDCLAERNATAVGSDRDGWIGFSPPRPGG